MSNNKREKHKLHGLLQDQITEAKKVGGHFSSFE